MLFAVRDDLKISPEEKRATILDFDKVLGLELDKRDLITSDKPIPEAIKKLATAREDARKVKDFKKSDELRDQIQKEGYEVMDTDFGPIIRKKL